MKLPSLNIPSIELPEIRTIIPPREYEHADWQYEKLMEEIKEFEDELNEQEEVALMLYSTTLKELRFF